MNPIVKNILAVIAGLFLGMIVNGVIIVLGMKIVPLPEGVDLTNLKEHMNNLGPSSFIFPFLAHAAQSLIAGFVAYKIAATSKLNMAMIAGAISLAFGIMNIVQIGGPLWFTVVDLVGAYMPMAWLGAKLAGGKSQ